ncbi:MAG: aldo/keto reductase [Synergistaceae bacterium]|jgi:aryl-alcohol dehydrogenase-like predicted oxidoreductase|nr:aldo/keto reductase [Synergistaceae bacterium]
MNYRKLGKTGFEISEISLGTWQLGGTWGHNFDENIAFETMQTAVDNGVNFFDTADVYNDGKSEEAIGKFLKKHSDKNIFVATKGGRGFAPDVVKGFAPEHLEGFLTNSLKRLQVDCIDLLQLHCPPTNALYNPAVFHALDNFKKKGMIKNYGVSVERVEEALKAIEFPGVATVQIIFNMFRLRPAELFFTQAAARDVGIIVRVPLASGLLTGAYTKDTKFGDQDHRQYNREGQSFDKGETFSGVDFARGLEAVEELKKVFPDRPLSEYALRYILMHCEVSCVIPGASRASQLTRNLKAMDVSPLTPTQMNAVKNVYETYIKDPVHYLW